MRFAFFFLLTLFPLQNTFGAFHDIGFEKYLNGEKAKDPQERRKAFNDALAFYLVYENNNSSGWLYYDIANCYFQLDETGLAITYYMKAQKLLPREEMVLHNLQIALKKAGQKEQEVSFFDRILFFHTYLSNYEKKVALVGFLFFSFILSSFALWFSVKIFKRLGICGLFVSVVLILSLMWSYLFSPLVAIVISPATLLRGPGQYYAPTQKEPLLSGQRLEVIDITEGGSWLKVRLPSGTVGYVGAKDARVV